MTSSGEPDVVSCGISDPFGSLSPATGKITYVLRTRAPLYRGRSPFSCDLHVLGAPLTFALSQDQTLQLKSGESVQATRRIVSIDLLLSECVWFDCGKPKLATSDPSSSETIRFSFQRPTGSDWQNPAEKGSKS